MSPNQVSPAAPSTERALPIRLELPAAVLLLCWVVPDVVADQLLFSWDRIGSAVGIDLAALLVPAVGGAGLLISTLALRATHHKALAALLIGDAVVVLPCLGSAPPFAMEWWLVLVLALAGLSIVAVRIARRGSPLTGRLLLLVVPLSLLLLAITAVLKDGDPPGYLAAYKAPVILWAGMTAAASSLAALMKRGKEPEGT